MACPHCGSWAVKADRSLAGRMVCGRCGRPLGRAAEGGVNRGLTRRSFPLPRGRGWWALVLLLAVSTALAWLAETRQQPFSPPRWPQPGQSGRGL
jgi:hypothetical protein